MAGGAGNFVVVAVTGAEAEAAESFVSQHVDCFVFGDTEGFVAVGIEDSVAGGFVWSGAEGFGGTFLADFADCHPNPLLHVLLHFCKWGREDCCRIFSCSVLIVGVDVGTGVGGIGQSFLVSNRFSDVEPALGQGVSCLTGALGMTSSGGGLVLSFRDLGIGCGTSANCPVASLCIVTGIDSAVHLTIGVCVLIVATVGVGTFEVGAEGAGWVSTSPCTFF